MVCQPVRIAESAIGSHFRGTVVESIAVVKLRYFAWVRERVGKPEEEIDPPANVATIAELMAWLSQRGEEYAHAFDNPKVIRAAVDHTHVKADAAIKGAREIAFFPPMTGG